MIKRFVEWLRSIFVHKHTVVIHSEDKPEEEIHVTQTTDGWTTQVIKLGCLLACMLLSSCTTYYHVFVDTKDGKEIWAKFDDPEMAQEYMNSTHKDYFKVSGPEKHVEYYMYHK